MIRMVTAFALCMAVDNKRLERVNYDVILLQYYQWSADMTHRISPLYLTVLILTLYAIPGIAQQGNYSKGFVGTYQIGHRFGASALTLKPDESYELKSSDCTLEYVQSGTYVSSSKVLHFQILKYIAKSHGGESEINLLDPKQRKEVFGNDREVMPTEFELLPIRWSDRIYLIYKLDLGNFANAINLGLEPRRELSSEPYYGSFFLRKGDERKKVSGSPGIPRKWRSVLLSRPVVGTIVSLRGDAKGTLATLNKGSKSGLRVGMRLLMQNEEPSPWSGAEIVSIADNSAIVRTADRIMVGDRLTTKYVSRIYR